MRLSFFAIAIAVLFFTFCIQLSYSEEKAVKFLSSFSFKEPFFPDAGASAVPGWEIRGSTVVMTDYIRLTPAEENRNGGITNRRPFFLTSLDLKVAFRVHSQTKLGADGMAIWLADVPLKQGNCFGGPETWNGIAIILDSFSNSGKTNIPQIQLHTNDGTLIYNVNDDGSNTLFEKCSADYRNSEISYLNIVYENSLLSVRVDARGNGVWQDCITNAAVKLPNRYFFSLSAATGGLSDNHDIMSFSVSTMDKKQTTREPPKVKEAPAEVIKELNTARQNEPNPIFDIDASEIEKQKAEIQERIKMKANTLVDSAFPIQTEEFFRADDADDDEDVIEKINDIKDSFSHQLLEIEVSLRDQVAQIRNQIPETAKHYVTLKDEILFVDRMVSDTLNLLHSIQKDVEILEGDSNYQTKYLAVANNVGNQLKRIESNIESLAALVDQVENDHRLQREVLKDSNETSFLPTLIFLILVIAVVVGIGYCCIKLVKSQKKPKRVTL